MCPLTARLVNRTNREVTGLFLVNWVSQGHELIESWIYFCTTFGTTWRRTCNSSILEWVNVVCFLSGSRSHNSFERFKTFRNRMTLLYCLLYNLGMKVNETPWNRMQISRWQSFACNSLNFLTSVCLPPLVICNLQSMLCFEVILHTVTFPTVNFLRHLSMQINCFASVDHCRSFFISGNHSILYKLENLKNSLMLFSFLLWAEKINSTVVSLQ